MDSLKFIYDENDLKEIRIICGDQELKDTIKIFCLNSIPSDLEHCVMEDEEGFIVSSEDHGEEILEHIFRYVYLVTKMAIIFKDKFSAGDVNVKDLDFSLLRPDIEKVRDLGWSDLVKLINEIGTEG